MRNSFWKSYFSDPDPPNYLAYSKFAWFWDKIQIQFWDPYPPNISKPPCLQFICMILGLNLDSVCGFWSFKKKGWNKCIQMSTKASNPRCAIHFGNLTFRILILQTTWFTANLHDFGTKSRFSFGILIFQTSPNHLVYSLFAWSWD